MGGGGVGGGTGAGNGRGAEVGGSTGGRLGRSVGAGVGEGVGKGVGAGVGAGAGADVVGSEPVQVPICVPHGGKRQILGQPSLFSQSALVKQLQFPNLGRVSVGGGVGGTGKFVGGVVGAVVVGGGTKVGTGGPGPMILGGVGAIGLPGVTAFICDGASVGRSVGTSVVGTAFCEGDIEGRMVVVGGGIVQVPMVEPHGGKTQVSLHPGLFSQSKSELQLQVPWRGSASAVGEEGGGVSLPPLDGLSIGVGGAGAFSPVQVPTPSHQAKVHVVPGQSSVPGQLLSDQHQHIFDSVVPDFPKSTTAASSHLDFMVVPP